jgi:hypothetical protein
MAQTKRLEKIIDELQDQLLRSKIIELGEQLGQDGVRKALEILDKLFGDIHEKVSIDDLYWSNLTQEEKEFILPVLDISPVASMFKNLPAQRRNRLMIDIRNTLWR